MIEIIQFISRYSLWVYLILAVALIVSSRSFFNAYKEQRNQVFGLEREITHQRIVQSVTGLIIIAILFLGEFSIATFLVPVLPASSMITTPTINPLLEPIGTIVPGSKSTAPGTPGSTSTPSQSTGCTPGKIMITDPKSGQEINGKISIIGTVDVPNFGFYKYEFATLGSDTWSTILAGNKPRIDDTLGSWDTTEITPGDYKLRLVVSDNTGVELAPCIIQVRIVK